MNFRISDVKRCRGELHHVQTFQYTWIDQQIEAFEKTWPDSLQAAIHYVVKHMSFFM